jgi:hypothetical protein
MKYRKNQSEKASGGGYRHGGVTALSGAAKMALQLALSMTAAAAWWLKADGRKS